MNETWRKYFFFSFSPHPKNLVFLLRLKDTHTNDYYKEVGTAIYYNSI